MKDYPVELWIDREWQITVSDASGVAMFTIQVLTTDAPAASARPA